jgi:ElaB/YqjD/DUF883 family membrane-anchored ribosome-binding protein
MAADPVVSRELKSLQEELSSTRRERREQSAAGTVARDAMTAAPTGSQSAEVPAASRLEETAEAKELRGELRDLVKELTGFVEDAEANISAHPAVSMVAAMLLGILIGSLLARR